MSCRTPNESVECTLPYVLNGFFVLAEITRDARATVVRPCIRGMRILLVFIAKPYLCSVEKLQYKALKPTRLP